MNIEQKLKMLLAYCGISQAELARRIGTTPANLNQKIKRNTLTYEELCKIGEVCGVAWEANFRTPDGRAI